MNCHFVCSQAKQLIALALSCTASTSYSVENGAPITPIGVSNYGAGILPPAAVGLTIAVRGSTYSSSELRDTSGERSPISVKLKVNSAALAFVKTTDISLFGGTYGFSVVVPYLDMSNRLTVTASKEPLDLRGANSAIGDVTLVPLMVQWTPAPGLFINGRLEWQLPTGEYKTDRLINTGSNHWTTSPAIAFTWINRSGLEVSSNIQLNFHGKNNDTQYQSGVEYQHEFAIGQHVSAWTFGMGGYVYAQLSDDKVQAEKYRNGNRSRVVGLGPAISLTDPGSMWPLISAHLYKEYGARNRTQGTQFAIRAAWSL